MKVISLTKGWVVWVDDEDHDRLAAFNWQIFFANRRAYAHRRDYIRKDDGCDVWGPYVLMHREVLGLTSEEGLEVDHIEHRQDKIIDNRKENLRACTRHQNMRNSRKRVDGTTSCFKGVCWSKSGANHWMGMIGETGRRRGCRHATDYDAAIWYDRQATERYGDFARTNIIGPHAMYASLPLSPNPDNSPLP